MTYFAKHLRSTVADEKPVKVEKEKKKYTYKREPTGELPIFQQITLERGLQSQVSGEQLHVFDVKYFAHILPKAQNKFPLFKLLKENIIIMTWEEHFMWDNKRSELKDKPEWQWVFKLESELLELYEAFKE